VVSASAPLHVEDRPGRRVATVWLHHGVGSARAWDPFLPDAPDGRRAIAYDRRGFGQSPHQRRFTSDMFDEDVDDLRTLLAGRGVERAHLVGHSDGGTIALLLAARSPELVATVTVIAVHVRGDPLTVATLRRMGPPTDWPATMQQSLRRAHGADWADLAGRWHALWTSDAWAGWTIVDELGGIRCPVLVVHAREDDLAPPLHAEAIAAALPATRVVWVDTATHDPHRVDRVGVIAEMRSLWQRGETTDG
jgi:pimeloyl-ACP methyl ester carboxylesterase